MAIVYQKTKGLTDNELHYCPGCNHGIVHKLVAEVMEELGILDDTVGVCPVGCSVFAYNYFNCDMQEAAHGRAPAVATGIKRTHPNTPVFTYQGDGDLASIGTAEIVHAAMRGEKFTTIFINNAIYGMTGGQMAPTTLIGQKATTCPLGRTKEQAGMPIRMAEMLSTLDGCVYAERVCVTDIPHLNKAKAAIKKAFQKQLAGEGFTFVEVLSTCPTNWGMTALKSKEWLEENMIPYYPLGCIKDIDHFRLRRTGRYVHR
jgi:2-oxoglutarate ferredoxin oxidoreductase subunit beta